LRSSVLSWIAAAFAASWSSGVWAGDATPQSTSAAEGGRYAKTSAAGGGRYGKTSATGGGRYGKTSATEGGRYGKTSATGGGRYGKTSAAGGGRYGKTSATEGGRYPAPAVGQATPTPEAALWGEIQRLRIEPATSEPFERHFSDTLARKNALLEKVRLYQTLYPGGPRRDRAVRLELQTLFDIASLSSGDFDALCARAGEYEQRPPCRAAQEEAAYWRIYCDRLGAIPATQPASGPDGEADAALLRAYDEYVMRFPAAAHTPRMATVVFEAALRRDDRATMRRMVKLLSEHQPRHAVTEQLAASLRRVEFVGRVFALTATTIDGKPIDVSAWRGAPLLIVFWADFDARSKERVKQVEAFRAQHRSVRVLGINLDADIETARSAADALGIAWPLVNDGLGWATSTAREWGVRRLPFVFVVDAKGVLKAATRDDAWRVAAEKAISN